MRIVSKLIGFINIFKKKYLISFIMSSITKSNSKNNAKLKDLTKVRVIQHNTVYVIGLSPKIATKLVIYK